MTYTRLLFMWIEALLMLCQDERENIFMCMYAHVHEISK